MNYWEPERLADNSFAQAAGHVFTPGDVSARLPRAIPHPECPLQFLHTRLYSRLLQLTRGL